MNPPDAALPDPFEPSRDPPGLRRKSLKRARVSARDLREQAGELYAKALSLIDQSRGGGTREFRRAFSQAQVIREQAACRISLAMFREQVSRRQAVSTYQTD